MEMHLAGASQILFSVFMFMQSVFNNIPTASMCDIQAACARGESPWILNRPTCGYKMKINIFLYSEIASRSISLVVDHRQSYTHEISGCTLAVPVPSLDEGGGRR